MKTNHKEDEGGAGFWKGETCDSCGGAIVERRVTLHRQVRGKHVLFENVPAGVCERCARRYFSANVLKTMQESLRGRRKAKRQVSVAVYSL